MSGPDFIATGMGAEGTRWLHRQLRRHPAFWLPPVEEMRLLGATGPVAGPVGASAPATSSAEDPADADFAGRLARLPRDRAPTLEEYRSLFEPAGGRISGDVARAHGRVPGATVEALVAAVPGLRAVVIVDDPVDLAWRALSLSVERGHDEAAVLSDPAALASGPDLGKLARHVSPARAVRAWSRLVPVKVIYLADLRERPGEAREEVARFLGAEPGGTWGIGAAEGLDEGPRLAPMPPAIRAALAGHLEDEIRRAASVLGGAAAEWPARHGLAATAPSKSDEATARLDRELEGLRAGGEEVSFAQFYARTALKGVEAGKPHRTLGPKLMASDDWSAAGRERHDLLVASAGLAGRPDIRVVDYGCGSLRVGQHFIRELDPGHYVGLDVIAEFYTMGLGFLGDATVAGKRPVTGLIGDPAAEDRAAALGADLVFANAVAFHVHPDEFGIFAGNIDRFSRKPGAVVLFDAMIYPEEVRYAHRGWARPLEAYLAALPGLEFRGVRQRSDDPRDGRALVMQLLEFRRPA